MGIVANSEQEVKDRVMEITRQPMAELANALGVAWAGGCGSWVGGGMDRIADGWQANYNGCGGHRAMDRLFIKYSDWRIELKNVVLLDNPTYTEMTPYVMPVVLDNYESSTPFKRVKKLTYKLTSEVTDTKTSSFSFGQELSLSMGIKPPSATGGPESSKSIKITFGQNFTTGHTERTVNETTEEETIEKEVPPYCRLKGALNISKVQASQAYAGIFRVSFAIRIGGFLKWGSNDPNSPETNYHKDYAGTDRRPWVDQWTWGKWGDDKKTFAQDLREKSLVDRNPWEWKRLFQQHPEARRAVDFLTNEANYEFELKGRLDNVHGTDSRVRFFEEEFNPAHAAEVEAWRRRVKLGELPPPEGLAIPELPEYLGQDVQV